VNFQPLKLHLHNFSKIKSHKEGLLKLENRKLIATFFINSSANLHCIVLVSVIGVIFSIYWTVLLKFSGEKIKSTFSFGKNEYRTNLERFSILNCCAGEIAQLQSEISHSERLREAMAVEMTKLTEKAEQVRTSCDLYRQHVPSLSLLHEQWQVVFRPGKDLQRKRFKWENVCSVCREACRDTQTGIASH
jgi:hypothetical protein